MKALVKPLFLLLVIALALSNTTFRLLLQTQVDFISMGFSGGKTLMLLGFFFCLFALERLALPWNARWNWLLFLGVGLLHGVALFERYLFLKPLGEPWRSYQAAITDGRFSSTRLAHLHEPKACLAWLTGYKGGGFDSGFQFLPYLPTGLLAGQAVLLLATVLVAFLVVHNYQRSNSTAKTLTLGMAVFAFVKASVDGGPFSTEGVVPVFFLFGCLYGGTGVKVATALTMLMLPLNIWLFGGSIGHTVGRTLGGYLLLCAPLLWEEARERESRVGVLGVLVYGFGLLMLPWFFYARDSALRKPPFSQGTLAYIHSTLTPGTVVYVHSPREISDWATVGLEPLETWKELSLQVTHARVVRETTPGEIADRFGLNPSWQPVAWYPRPAYHEMVGNFPKAPPAGWPRSKMVLAYQWEELSPGKVRISMALQGGGLISSASSCLPEGSFVVTDYRYTGRKPDMRAWKHGPGWDEGLTDFEPSGQVMP